MIKLFMCSSVCNGGTWSVAMENMSSHGHDYAQLPLLLDNH